MDALRGFVHLAAEAITSDGRQWIEVMPTVEKARNGRQFYTITAADLTALASYIASNGGRIPVDYDHEGAAGGSTVAAGWFTGNTDIRESADGPRLWAEVEWTPQGRVDVESKRFKFISPEWTMSKVDKTSGLATKAKELLAATLTNRPFFKQLAPLTASDLSATHELVLELAAALGEESDALYARLTETAAPPPDPKEIHMSDQLKLIAAALGLPEDADEATITAKAAEVKATAEKAPGDDVVVLDKDTVTKLTASAAKGEQAAKEIHDMKREQLLTAAVETGKILPVQRDAFASMYDVDADNVKALLDATPEKSFSAAKGGDAGAPETADEKAVARVQRQFASDGLADRAPVDQAQLHLKAMEILGKTDYSPAEYVAAVTRAQDDLDIVYRDMPSDE
jgi:phage I-like protein